MLKSIQLDIITIIVQFICISIYKSRRESVLKLEMSSKFLIWHNLASFPELPAHPQTLYVRLFFYLFNILTVYRIDVSFSESRGR